MHICLWYAPQKDWPKRLAYKRVLTYCVYVRHDSFNDRLRNLDLYAVLEIAPHADEEEIRRAYRRGALACHPDKHPDDAKAAQRFVLLTQARDVLLDPAARAAYDRLREQHGIDDRAGFTDEDRPRRRGRKGHVSDPVHEQQLAERARRTRSSNELAALWQAGSVVVRAAVLRNAACPVHLFSDPHVEGHWMLSLEAARRVQCPANVLDKLALSFEHCVAMAVAAHPSTSAEGLGSVAARHRDLNVLCSIANHPNANADVLRDVGRAVRGPRSALLGCTLLAHPACPSDLAQRIRQRLGDMVA